MSRTTKNREEIAATASSRAVLLAELLAAFDAASANAADPVAQKAFRAKFAECRKFIEE